MRSGRASRAVVDLNKCEWRLTAADFGALFTTRQHDADYRLVLFNIVLLPLTHHSLHRTCSGSVSLGSVDVERLLIRLTEIKRFKMILTMRIYYNTRPCDSIVSLKNSPQRY